MHAIERMLAPLGRRVDEASPLCDARLPDGSRVNVVIPPLSLSGPVPDDPALPRARASRCATWSRAGRCRAELAELLALCVAARASVLVSGGTGSGKTTTLNALSGAIPGEERIVTIEDAAELRLRQRHVVRLEARPANLEGRGEVTIRQLVRNALRMRPDRIVVGEVRGAEALDMLQALNTGHDGSLTTVHANSPEDALRRVETLALMAGVGLPHAAVREQVASALDLVVHQARLPDGAPGGGVGRRGGARGRRGGRARALPARRRAAAAAGRAAGRAARAAAAGGRAVSASAAGLAAWPALARRSRAARLLGARRWSRGAARAPARAPRRLVDVVVTARARGT